MMLDTTNKDSMFFFLTNTLRLEFYLLVVYILYIITRLGARFLINIRVYGEMMSMEH